MKQVSELFLLVRCLFLLRVPALLLKWFFLILNPVLFASLILSFGMKISKLSCKVSHVFFNLIVILNGYLLIIFFIYIFLNREPTYGIFGTERNRLVVRRHHRLFKRKFKKSAYFFSFFFKVF